MAIFTGPITLNEPVVRSGEVEKGPTERFGRKRFYLNSSKEGQEWSTFATDSKNIPKTHELYSEHGVEERGSQQLMYVDIGVRVRAEQPPEVADGLDKLSKKDLLTKAPSLGVVVNDLMTKTEIIDAFRAKKTDTPTT
jgi:hypothetical protein